MSPANISGRPQPTLRHKGGPKTEDGKAVSSKNALRHGLSSQTWLDSTEQSQYDELLAELIAEYSASGPTMILQMERLAIAMIKIRRLQKIENALYEKAKITAEFVAKAKPKNSIATYLPDTADGQRLAERIAVESALPDLDRLNTLARYQVSLDRQISKVIGEIQILHASRINREIRDSTTDSAKVATALPSQIGTIDDAKLGQ